MSKKNILKVDFMTSMTFEVGPVVSLEALTPCSTSNFYKTPKQTFRYHTRIILVKKWEKYTFKPVINSLSYCEAFQRKSCSLSLLKRGHLYTGALCVQVRRSTQLPASFPSGSHIKTALLVDSRHRHSSRKHYCLSFLKPTRSPNDPSVKSTLIFYLNLKGLKALLCNLGSQ